MPAIGRNFERSMMTIDGNHPAAHLLLLAIGFAVLLATCQTAFAQGEARQYKIGNKILTVCPKFSDHKDCTYKQNVTVTALETRTDWLGRAYTRVRLSDGHEGWIYVAADYDGRKKFVDHDVAPSGPPLCAHFGALDRD
jgi:hypothetical protein